jgi:hypothetical protein
MRYERSTGGRLGMNIPLEYWNIQRITFLNPYISGLGNPLARRAQENSKTLLLSIFELVRAFSFKV